MNYNKNGQHTIATTWQHKCSYNIHGQASGESNTQLSDYGDEHEEYGVNMWIFETTEKDIEELREKYQIPYDITLRLLRGDEMASKLSDGETVVHTNV